jgi:hypothetical protein
VGRAAGGRQRQPLPLGRAGAHWTFVSTLSDYWGALNASITDADLFAYGGVELFKTTDGGGSFVKQNGWGDYYGDPAHKLHADMMGFDVYPDGAGGEVWYVNTHGGTYRSTDGWPVHNLSLSGLNVRQYYTTLTSAANPLHIVAGAQDQGYQWTDNPPGGRPDRLRPDHLGRLRARDFGRRHARLRVTRSTRLPAHPQGREQPDAAHRRLPVGRELRLAAHGRGDPDDAKDCFFCASHLYSTRRAASASTTGCCRSTAVFDFAAAAAST